MVSALFGLYAAAGVVVLLKWMGFAPADHPLIAGLLICLVFLSFAVVPVFVVIWRLEKNALRERVNDESRNPMQQSPTE